MSRTTPASTKAQKSQCFFEGVAGLWPATLSPKEKNTDFFCAFVLAGVVLDIWEGQPRPPLRLTFLEVPPHPPPSFLSAPGPLRLTFFGAPSPSLELFLTLGKVKCHRHLGGEGAQTDIFFGGGGRGFKSQTDQSQR